jgi:hypothetical protein
MVVSLILGLLGQRAGYLARATGDTPEGLVPAQFGLFAVVVVPPLATLGACLFLTHQLGRRQSRWRADRLLVMAILGAAAAVLFFVVCSPVAGRARLLAPALGAVALAIWIVAQGRARRLAVLELVVLASEMLWPGQWRDSLGL